MAEHEHAERQEEEDDWQDRVNEDLLEMCPYHVVGPIEEVEQSATAAHRRKKVVERITLFRIKRMPIRLG